MIVINVISGKPNDVLRLDTKNIWLMLNIDASTGLL